MKILNKYLLIACLISNQSYTQSTTTLNLQDALQTRFIGYTNNFPLNIYTNNRHRAYFSTNESINWGLNGQGDGLVIRNAQPTSEPGAGIISIFTSPLYSNGTEIVMGLSGNVAGRSNRFEMWGNYSDTVFNFSFLILTFRGKPQKRNVVYRSKICGKYG